MATTYDFVIVGAGTAGCLLANRLAHSAARPSVLVIEAGGKPEGEYLHAPFHRYHPVALRPDLDHGHMSEPEPALNGRQIPYTRGKGLGGSSILNFGVYLYGSGEDYNRWADLVDDETWRWESVQRSFREIENYNFEGSKQYSHLANPSTNQHGKNGTLKVGLPPVLEAGVVPQMEAVAATGEKINLDPNSGDPVGVSVFPYSYSKAGRSTSAAHLLDPPKNLDVWINASLQKFLWDGDRVAGIVTDDGRRANAKKEVILAAGAIDTPKLLLINGIGPKAELEALGIDVKADLPGVGKHLQDHVLAFMTVEMKGSQNERWAFESNAQKQVEAEEAWAKDQSGAFALTHSCLWGGFLKFDDLKQWDEYKALPADHREFLDRPAVPAYEFINNCLLWPPGTQLDEGNTYMTCIAFLMNPQSEGSITLRSNKPEDKPILKLNFLTHPYDAKIFREAVRATWQKLVENPTISQSVIRTITGPRSMSDADIDAFVADNAGTVWHANGSAKMGRQDDPSACVDSDFKVRGVKGLRVADLSVAPLTTNNHTQATAYLIGQKAAEQLVREYGLSGESRPAL